MGRTMTRTNDTLIFRNSIFAWIAVVTAAVLVIPLVAMQFTTDVRWNRVDFLVMGALLFGLGSLFVLASRRISRKRRLLLGAGFVATFLYVWAELAVGIFTNLGS